MKNKLIAVISALTLFSNTVYGAVLGTEITSWSHKIANGADLYKNEFMSEQSGVGMQTEYYAKYTPNKDVLPIVVGGKTVWGLRNIKKSEEYMKNIGLVPLIGVNATFFSFETGIPMGISVSDGRILTKDTEGYQAIGFKDDGTAFIDFLKVTTMLKSGENEIEISHINKFNQEVTPIVNLYTDDFDDNNHNDIPSVSIILGEIEGNLGIGETLNAVVEDKFIYTGPVLIPEGKMILTLNENSDEFLLESFNSMEIGDSVQISSFANDERWSDVSYAMGSVGDRLVENGVINSGFEKGAAPRTAVGITDNGDIIFYVLDGRQKGYSYGAQIATIAKRLKELGCVDAINLDGGGSTSILGVYPGADEGEVLNSPSEGKLRGCANYLFLKNVSSPTGTAGGVYLYPFEQHYLSGYSEKLTKKAVDSNFYPVSVPEDTVISASGESSFDNDTGILTARGTGLITVTASCGDVDTKTYYHSYETPTEIVVKDSNGSIINRLTLKKDDIVSLNFEAWYNGIRLKANQDSFKLSLNNEIGIIDGNTIKITANGGGGVLSVSVGERICDIPITIKSVYPFSDIANHWAREQIKAVYEEGIVSGYETESGFSFLPLKNMTREEFAVMMCRMLGTDVSRITECSKAFDDLDEISDWSKPYVFAMVNKNIIAGKSSSTGKLFFSPRVTLTRAEAITILSRVLNLENTAENKFLDDADIPDWAKEAIYSMYEKGFITGYPDNTILPNANVTRAEAAAMIYNIISKSF